MSADTLLHELAEAGVRLIRTGDDLLYETQPGIRIAPFVEHILANKPNLLKQLLQREIVAAVAVEPEHFGRQSYDELWSRYHALEAKEPNS